MIVTDETKALAQRIVDYIIENPDKHEQAVVWGKVNYNDADEVVGITDYITPSERTTICDTVMCIAGTAAYLNGGIQELSKVAYGGDWETHSGELLGLDNREACSLFYTMNEDKAFDAVVAIASGDESKFYDVLNLPQVDC